MFRTLFSVTACASLCLLSACLPSAQEVEQSTIKVGGSVTDAEEVLGRLKIEFREGGLSFARMPDDVGYLVCVVDEHRTWIVLFYSKSTGEVTSMNAVTFPQQHPRKIEEIWSRAKSVTLCDDGSYSIHFLPAEPPKTRRSVYPKASF